MFFSKIIKIYYPKLFWNFFPFFSSSSLAVGDHGQLYQCSPPSCLPRHVGSFQHSLFPMSDIIRPASPWSSPRSPAINASLEDVRAEVLDSDDRANYCSFRFLLLSTYCLFIPIFSRTDSLVLWSVQLMHSARLSNRRTACDATVNGTGSENR